MHTVTGAGAGAAQQHQSLRRLLECFLFSGHPFQPTGERSVGASCDRNQVLDDVLTVRGLAAATLSQQHNGLILARRQQVPIGSLC